MAGRVLPKLSIFLFLSVICMLVNISVCIYASVEGSSSLSYLDTNDYDYQGNIEESNTEITATNYAGGMATSFIPFASIVSVYFLNVEPTVFYFVTIIITIIGALQLLMLILIGLCFVPNVLGSGVDV